MEDWKSQSEPEPDFRDNSNLLGKSPRKKKKKSSRKGTKNESDVWSDHNNPERVPESVIHENLNTLNRSIIEEWQSDNEARGREDKWPYKGGIYGQIRLADYVLPLRPVRDLRKDLTTEKEKERSISLCSI